MIASSISQQVHGIENELPTAVGVVVIIHGFAEHAGRFSQLEKRLKAIGLNALSITLKGHGQKGVRPDISAFDDYLPPILQTIERLKANTRIGKSGGPVILIGQSMGALVACRVALEATNLVSGLILSSPAFGVADKVPRLALAMLNWLSRFAPSFPMLPPPRFGAAALTRLHSEQVAFESDPLCWHGWLGPRMASELAYASRDTEAKIEKLNVPVLMTWGERDTVISPNAMRRAASKIDSRTLSVRTWPDSKHHLFTDSDAESHFQHIASWLSQHWIKDNT